MHFQPGEGPISRGLLRYCEKFADGLFEAPASSIYWCAWVAAAAAVVRVLTTEPLLSSQPRPHQSGPGLRPSQQPRHTPPTHQVTSRASNEGYPKVPEDFRITEKAPTRALSWLKAPTSTFTYKTLC